MRFYDRALHHQQQAPCDNDDDYVMVAVGNQRFRASLALGDEYVIEGTLQAIDTGREDMSMKSRAGRTVYHSAKDVVLALTWTDCWLDDTATDAFDEKEHLMGSTDSFVAYRVMSSIRPCVRTCL